MAKKKNHVFKHELVRHHCSTCKGRVFPFDSFVKDEAPDGFGIKKPAILMTSWNQKNKDNRWAWCWTCKEQVSVDRITEADIHKMYLARRGVIVRGFTRSQ